MTEQDAIAAMEALEAQNAAKAREVQMAAAMAADKTVVSDTDTTFTGNVTSMASSKLSSAPKKKGTKAKLTAKEKKERSVSFLRMVMCVRPEVATHCILNQIEAERIIACLPLEFRGSDPVCLIYIVQAVIQALIITIQGLRRNMESVIGGLMYSSNQVVKCELLNPFLLNASLTLWKVTDLIVPPDLNQARVNKCLIALVNRKIVLKENSTVCSIFRLKALYSYLIFSGDCLVSLEGPTLIFFFEDSLLGSHSALPM